MKHPFYPCYCGGKRKAFTVSYDDGNTCDEPLVALLRSHHAKGTFNINSGLFHTPDTPSDNKKWRRMSAEECLQLYGTDMEIAVHGAFHPFWNRLSPVSAMQDILEDKRALEQLTGRIIRGAAYPYGTYNDDVVQILRLAGFAYCRTTIATKTLRLQADNPLCFHATIHSRKPELPELAQKFAAAESTGSPLLLYVWGHSYEFVEDNNLRVFENLLQTVCGREDVWYCTNIELFDYLAAAKSLRWSAAQTMVHNPSAIDVWLCGKAGEAVCIPSGKTVSL